MVRRIDQLVTRLNQPGSGPPLAAVGLPLVPLDAQAAFEALVNAVSTPVMFVILTFVFVLLFVSFPLFGAAALSYASGQGSRQGDVGRYVKAGAFCLLAAGIVGGGPAVLDAMGAPIPDSINAVQVFTGN